MAYLLRVLQHRFLVMRCPGVDAARRGKAEASRENWKGSKPAKSHCRH